VEELVHAIKEASRGAVYLSPSVSRAAVQAYLDSKTTKEIAQSLAVTVKTAESHRGRIMEKLGIHNTAGLVRYSIRHGVIEP
jgi:two-component system response regulator NreC